MGRDARKPVFGSLQITKANDQPAHPQNLIRTFVIPLLESIISKLATSEISLLYLVCVAKQASFCMA